MTRADMASPKNDLNMPAYRAETTRDNVRVLRAPDELLRTLGNASVTFQGGGVPLVLQK
jgi:hypothetical protein